MEKKKKILCTLCEILQNLLKFPNEDIFAHIDEPLNGAFFDLTAVDMVYFVLEIRKTMDISLSNELLQKGMDLSIIDLVQAFVEESQQ